MSMDGSDERRLRNARFTLGVLGLGIVTLLWTGSGFLTAWILQGAESYDKPFLVTWLQTSSFALYLIGPACFRSCRSRKEERKLFLSDDARPAVEPLTTRETAQLAAQFCLAWFAANWAMNSALSRTSVSSTVILSSTSSLFTLILGRMIGTERIDVAKLAAVGCSIVGVALVTNADRQVDPEVVEAPRRVVGDALALLSAMLYAVYVSLLKSRAGDESRLNLAVFFGFVGLWNILCLWPVAFLLNALGVETLEMPPSERIVLGLVVNAAITFISDFIYAKSTLQTSPLTATLALSLTVPLSLLGDVLVGTRFGGAGAFAGAVLVLGAFTAVGLLDHRRALDEASPLFHNADSARSQGVEDSY